ncbi:MAG: HNH endonuclease [Limnochordia bacterium]|jgi:hypothetical protein
MAAPEITTVREQIAWSYANLAMADAALGDSAERYERNHYAIRNRLYHGLMSGRMSMRSLYHDERLKMTMPQACYYCGSDDSLAVDHLIPRIKGGRDEAGNLVWACRSCNSSKQGRDMLEWMKLKCRFPSVLLLRRYIKVVAGHCELHGCMDVTLAEAQHLELPFDLRLLPTQFPPLNGLQRWVHPAT